MTLELKRYKDDFFDNSTEPYSLGGVEEFLLELEQLDEGGELYG